MTHYPNIGFTVASVGLTWKLTSAGWSVIYRSNELALIAVVTR
jgi:hypothetical protein